MIDQTASENVSLRELSGSSEVNVDTARNRNAVPHARDFPRHGSGVQRLLPLGSVKRILCDVEIDFWTRESCLKKIQHFHRRVLSHDELRWNTAETGRQSRSSAKSLHNRRGQALVEFAVIALALYLLLAAILTFGHLLYVAQGLQTAADLGAREISRTPLPAMVATQTGEQRPLLFEDLTGGCNNLDVDHTPNSDASIARRNFQTRIFDEAWLVIDLDEFYAEYPGGSVFEILVPQMPLLNQQLTTMMIVDRPDLDGNGTPDRRFLRYPGALLRDSNTPSGFTVGIPLVTGPDDDGIETIRWIPVVEEIEPKPFEVGPNGIRPQCDPEVVMNGFNPFAITNPDTRGIVALRINYPFQSAAMSSFRENPAGPFEPNIDTPNVADDGGVFELNPDDRPGDLTGAPLESGELYRGTYAGQYGLGAQGALGSAQLTGGRPVRPYRRVVSAQAIYRREIFQ